MGNRVVIFPVGKEAQAAAYLAVCNANNPDAGQAWSLIHEDVHGQAVVAYLGPPFKWAGVEVLEPASCLAARVDGVLAESWDQPPEE